MTLGLKKPNEKHPRELRADQHRAAAGGFHFKADYSVWSIKYFITAVFLIDQLSDCSMSNVAN